MERVIHIGLHGWTMIMDEIKQQIARLKEGIRKGILNLANLSCEVDLGRLQIRQSFSYYDEEVYHIEKLYIDPDKGTVRVQLYEYAHSIPVSEFSIEDQVRIYEELAKTFENPHYQKKIDYC